MKAGSLAFLPDELLGFAFLPIPNTKHDARREHADGSSSGEGGSDAREGLLLAGVAAEHVAVAFAVERTPRAAEDRSNSKRASRDQKSDAHPPDPIGVFLEPKVQVLIERISLSYRCLCLSGRMRRTREHEHP